MATSIIISTLTSLHVWAKLFPYYQWSKSLLLYSSLLYVCEAFSSLCVCSPTFLLSSCGFKNKFSHSLFQAHLKIRIASLCYRRSMVCVCEAHHWSLKQPWIVVCMHRSVIVDECFVECCSGLTNASFHLIEWGNEEYLCVCVCVSGGLVDHNRSLFSLWVRRASIVINLGHVLGLTRD